MGSEIEKWPHRCGGRAWGQRGVQVVAWANLCSFVPDPFAAAPLCSSCHLHLPVQPRTTRRASTDASEKRARRDKKKKKSDRGANNSIKTVVEEEPKATRTSGCDRTSGPSRCGPA